MVHHGAGYLPYGMTASTVPYVGILMHVLDLRVWVSLKQWRGCALKSTDFYRRNHRIKNCRYLHSWRWTARLVQAVSGKAPLITPKNSGAGANEKTTAGKTCSSNLAQHPVTIYHHGDGGFGQQRTCALPTCPPGHASLGVCGLVAVCCHQAGDCVGRFSLRSNIPPSTVHVSPLKGMLASVTHDVTMTQLQICKWQAGCWHVQCDVGVWTPRSIPSRPRTCLPRLRQR